MTDPVDQWPYFFRRAADCTPEELVRRLPDPVFNEAAEVFQMIAQTLQNEVITISQEQNDL